MRIGMILECTLEGPDVAVYKYVVQKLCPQVTIEKPITKGDKKVLINEAALEAKTLIDSGCQFVFIIWDRIPRWGLAGNCTTDKEELTTSLQNLEVSLDKIALCCIDEMLESWIIADCRGFMTWIRSKTKHNLAEFGDHKTKAEQTAPKDRIKNYLRDNFNKWKYADYVDNLEIIKSFPDFDRAAKWNESFNYFKKSVERICPN